MYSSFPYDLWLTMMLRYDVDDDITDQVRWKGCFEVVCCCLLHLLLLLGLFVDSLSRKNEFGFISNIRYGRWVEWGDEYRAQARRK